MKPIPLNLTPRRKEVLWHAAYNETDWSASAFVKPGHRPLEKIVLGHTDVSAIVQMMKHLRLIRFEVTQIAWHKWELSIRITPLGMDVLLGNVACVDPKGLVLVNARKIGSEIGLIERGMW